MVDLKGKVILVTGSSSGIGKAIAERLVVAGSNVVGCARNYKKLIEIADNLNAKGLGVMIPVQCNVANEEEILNIFKMIENKYQTIHAVINNAGTAVNSPLLTGKSEGWLRMLKVNVLAVAICCREAIKLMEKFGVKDGHVVNINSLNGHNVYSSPITHFYTATKFALTALTDGLRKELREKNSKIRVTAISPGVVETNFAYSTLPNQRDLIDQMFKSIKAMKPEDMADAVLYALTANQRINIYDILVRRTHQGPDDDDIL